MADINLLQNQLKDTTITANRRSMAVIWIEAFILTVLLLGLGGLYFLDRNMRTETERIATENDGIQTQISNASEDLDSAKLLQAKLENIDTLMKNHLYMTPVLDAMEQFTYVNAKYGNLTIDQDGETHIEGEVSSYNDLGKLLLGLSTSNNFSDVKLLAVNETSETGLYQFSIELQINPDLSMKGATP